MKRHYEIDPGDDVFCECCGTMRTATVIDVGYGETEFWGSVSNHVDLVTVCNYCESGDILHPDEVEVDEEEAA